MSKKIIAEMQGILKSRENLIIEGPHGSGKTMMVTELFDKEFGPGNWVWFSAPTMDPFVDFIGCPKEVTAKDGLVYLDLVRPERFARDQIKAIFIDEFNRAPKKVKNALMELLQFKQINGKKFHNLELIWAAINPADGDYDVEEMDPAQLDRFHAHIQIHSEPNRDFFTNKFSADIAEGAISWWKGLPKDLQKQVSPRRLEYALTGFLTNGNPITLYLPPKTDTQKLVNDIKSGNIDSELRKAKTFKSKKQFFKDENNFAKVKHRMQDVDWLTEWMVYFPSEKISATISDLDGDSFNQVVGKIVLHFNDSQELEDLKSTCSEIVKANNNKETVAKIEDSEILTI